MKRQRHRQTVRVGYRGRQGDFRTEKVLLLGAAVCAIAAAVCAWVLPGVRFSAYLFAGLAGLAILSAAVNRLSKQNRIVQILRIALRVGLILALAAFAAAEGTVILGGRAVCKDTRPDAVIVLGAGVNGKSPSLILNSRIDAAEQYLKKYPEVSAVLSGGQGRGEEISEAQAIFEALTDRGIDPKRLILDEDSFSTAENLKNSAALLLKYRGLNPADARVAIVSSDFHLFRACRLAEAAGMEGAFGVPAEVSWWWLNANYYVREAFALWKMAAVSVL